MVAKVLKTVPPDDDNVWGETFWVVVGLLHLMGHNGFYISKLVIKFLAFII